LIILIFGGFQFVSMVTVTFYDPDFQPYDNLIYSVIAAKYYEKWVFVRHHERLTFEIPGGHIEEGEIPHTAAKRELMEETGALKFKLICIATYSVTADNGTIYGKLFFAEIFEMGEIPDHSEIAEIAFLNTLPNPVTYPEIQPHLFKKVLDYLKPQV
jgi:8-oxo-dGTP diphosphatase